MIGVRKDGEFIGWFLGLFLLAVPASSDLGFDEKYERDYNIFDPINQYNPNNPLNPINRYNPRPDRLAPSSRTAYAKI